MKNNELEQRLISFGVTVLRSKPNMTKSFESTHLFNQLVRSATAAPLLYAESNGAESMKDFVHKLALAVKELRESKVNMQMIKMAELCKDENLFSRLIQESSELIAILISSIQTTKRKYPNAFK